MALFISVLLYILSLVLSQTTISTTLSNLETLTVSNGNIFVSGREKIYKFDEELNLLKNKSKTNSETTLLDEYTHRTDIIICYVSGSCEVRATNDLEIKTSVEKVSPRAKPPGSRVMAVIQSQHTQNLKAGTPTVNAAWIVNSATELNIGLSIRNATDLSVFSYELTEWFGATGVKSSLKYKGESTLSQLEYLDIFAYKKSKYIIKNYGDTGRIASICADDSRLVSYMELPVQCGEGYTFIQSAFETLTIGEHLKSSLNSGIEEEHTDMYLFLIFGTSKDSANSKLCAIHVQKLIPVFNDIFAQCRTLNGRSTVELGPSEWAVGRATNACSGSVSNS